MKTVLMAFALTCACPLFAAAQVPVRGHYNYGGHYVQPHHRSMPDHSYNNNWSVYPNVNPYTHRQGTHLPTFDDRSPSRSSFDPLSRDMDRLMRPSDSIMGRHLYGR